MSWHNKQLENGDVHTLPIDDLIEHELTDSCVCGVRTDPAKRKDGSIGWQYIHNSLDGREKNEVD